jgi:hypothetical protein
MAWASSVTCAAHAGTVSPDCQMAWANPAISAAHIGAAPSARALSATGVGGAGHLSRTITAAGAPLARGGAPFSCHPHHIHKRKVLGPMNKPLVALAGLALLGAACSAKSAEVNTPATSHSSASTAPTKSVAHVGATLSLSAGGASEQVTLLQVIDPAQGADQFNTPDPGKRFVATVFRITNTGTAAGQGDADNDAAVIGSDGQSYTADLDTVGECTDFDDGSFSLGPGESVTGCVVFQLPTGTTVARVQWTPASGFASVFGEWLVP